MFIMITYHFDAASSAAFVAPAFPIASVPTGTPASLGLFAILEKQIRGTVGGNHPHFVGNIELIHRVRRVRSIKYRTS
jgi:hypothetical protein